MGNDKEMNSECEAIVRARAGGPPAHGEDAELVERFRSGDKAAFEQIFKKYQKPIYNFAARMVSAQDAADVTQDAFYSAMRAIDTYDRRRRFSTWLFAIAKNRCYDILRRRGRLSLQSCDDMTGYAGEGPARAEEALAESELSEVVEECLAQLSPQDRLVILLRDFHQLSHEEISEVLEASIPSVKSRIHRARMRLKEKMIPHLDRLGIQPE
jgi:RNA polymerase sigma-70 factor (ECF subfamily)